MSLSRSQDCGGNFPSMDSEDEINAFCNDQCFNRIDEAVQQTLQACDNENDR